MGPRTGLWRGLGETPAGALSGARKGRGSRRQPSTNDHEKAPPPEPSRRWDSPGCAVSMGRRAGVGFRLHGAARSTNSAGIHGSPARLVCFMIRRRMAQGSRTTEARRDSASTRLSLFCVSVVVLPLKASARIRWSSRWNTDGSHHQGNPYYCVVKDWSERDVLLGNARRVDGLRRAVLGHPLRVVLLPAHHRVQALDSGLPLGGEALHGLHPT